MDRLDKGGPALGTDCPAILLVVDVAADERKQENKLKHIRVAQ